MGRPNQPMRELIIEGLSTKMVTRSVDQVDDITRELIPIDPRSVPRAGDLPALARANKIKAERTQVKAALRSADVLTNVINQMLSGGMVGQAPPKPIEPAHNQVHTETGLVITVGKARGLRRL